MTEVEQILLAAESRMKRRFHIEQGQRIKEARVKRRSRPKRHGENKERSYRDRKNASRRKHEMQQLKNHRIKYLQAARKFWLGESDVHP